jgi:hypothetical protein
MMVCRDPHTTSITSLLLVMGSDPWLFRPDDWYVASYRAVWIVLLRGQVVPALFAGLLRAAFRFTVLNPATCVISIIKRHAHMRDRAFLDKHPKVTPTPLRRLFQKRYTEWTRHGVGSLFRALQGDCQFAVLIVAV